MLVFHEGRTTGAGLILTWEGAPDGLIRRLVSTFFLLPGILATAAVALTLQTTPPGELGIALLGAGALLGFGLFAAALIGGIGRSYWSRLAWDARLQRLEAVQAGRFIWLRRSIDIPYSSLECVSLAMAEEADGPTPVRLDLRYRDGERVREASALLLVQGLNRRVEAFDLGHRIARATGWEGCVTRRNDPRRLELELVPSASVAGAAAVPPGEAPADYAADVVPDAEEPEFLLPPFDPRTLRSPDTIEVWEPGGVVHFRRRGPTGRSATILGAGSGLTAAAVVLGAGTTARHLVIAGVVGAAAFYLVRWVFGLHDRELVFDWSARKLRVRRGRRTRCFDLDDVTTLVLDGRTGSAKRGPRYFCSLMVEAAGERMEVLQTLPSVTPDAAYLTVASLANALGRALSVPWEWDRFPEGLADLRRTQPTAAGRGF